MSVARLHALIAQVEAAVEFDPGPMRTRLGRDAPGGGHVLIIWWSRGCRRLTIRLYLGNTTVEVSASMGRGRRKGVEYLIAGDLDFLGVSRRGVDWLRSDAPPREFDPRRWSAEVVPDFDEEP